MITLQAQMDDGSIVDAIFNDDGTFTYSSEFRLQIDGFYFPGLTIFQSTPLASAAVESATLYFRIGAASWPQLPYGHDYQEFKIDMWTRQGQECYIDDGSTVVHCRQIVSADLETTAPPVNQVPLPGWSIGVTMALIIGIAVRAARRPS